MKNNKGFTLIELLAVIVILGMVIAISLPEVLNIIEESKKETMNLSVKSIEHNIKNQLHNLELKGQDFTGTFTVVNGQIQEENNYSLNLDKTYNGTIEINDAKQIAIALHNNRYCTVKKSTSSEVTTNELTPAGCTSKKVMNLNTCYTTMDFKINNTPYAYILEYSPPTFEIDYDMCVNEMNNPDSFFGDAKDSLNIDQESIRKICNGEKAVNNSDDDAQEITYDMNFILATYNYIHNANLQFGEEISELENSIFKVIKNYNSTGNNCSKEVEIPETINGKTILGLSLAFGYKNLTKITLPSTVENIGLTGLTFYGNPLLEEDGYIYSRNIDGTLNKNIIYGYGGLDKDLTIPTGTIEINDSAFEDIPIETLTIPDTVKIIGDSAFYGCEINSLNMGNGIETLEDDVFSANNLSNLVLSNNLKAIGSNAFDYNQLTNLIIPSSVETIGSYAFGSNELTNITFESGTKILENGISLSAFQKRNYSNPNLSTIVYPGTTLQDWNDIINGETGTPFTTGTVTNALGNVTISAN